MSCGTTRGAPYCRAMKRFLIVAGLLVCGVLGWARAPLLSEPDWQAISGVEQPPVVSARAAILVDVASATILYAKQPDLVIPPASLTKVVAIDTALAAVARGELSLSERFVPPEPSWWTNQPPRSSLMFLGPGQSVSLHDLLVGLAVPSGNDSAVAVAELVAGGVDGFADLMNARMRELGLIDPFFVEPSGYSDRNTITARSFARFLLAHIERFPDALRDYYSQRTFTYPTADHVLRSGAAPVAGAGSASATAALGVAPITQSNRNSLLWIDPSVDGFKTGYIDASGYNLAATASRTGRRLVAIVLGIDAPDAVTGTRIRTAEAAALLEYGFRAFESLSFGVPSPSPVRVYGGQTAWVEPSVATTIGISVPAGRLADLDGVTSQYTAVDAPIGRADVGSVSIALDGEVLGRAAITIPEQPHGRWWRRAIDAVARLYDRLIRRVEIMNGR